MPALSTNTTQKWENLDPEDMDSRLATLGLCLNKPESAIICMRCKYALNPSAVGISKHLWEKHQVPPAARKGLKVFVVSLRLDDPNKLALRTDGCRPHPHLLIQQGVACKRCLFRSTSRDLMRRHMSKEHSQKSGRNKWLGDGIHDNVSLQSWTQNGARGYWLVRPLDDTVLPDIESSSECSPRRRAMVASIHEEEQQRLAQLDQNRSVTDNGTEDIALTSTWMRRTGWAKTFKGADRRLLSLLSQRPAVDGHSLELGCYGTRVLYSSADDERRLVAIAQAVDHFFDRCEDTARHTEHSIRCWLRSNIPGRSYKAPFELPGRESTIKQYRAWWKRMMFVFFRLYRLDHVARDRYLSVQLSDEQKEAFGLVWATAQVSAHNNGGGNDGTEDEDEGEHEHEHEEAAGAAEEAEEEDEEQEEREEQEEDEDDEDDEDNEDNEDNYDEGKLEEEEDTSDDYGGEVLRNSGPENGIPT
jgi:hypothetical protein